MFRRARPLAEPVESCTICGHPAKRHHVGVCGTRGCNWHVLTVNARCNGPLRSDVAGQTVAELIAESRERISRLVTTR